MIFDGFVHQLPDIDPTETQEWLDSLDAVVDVHGKARARFLLSKLLDHASANQVSFPATVSTPYVNTIPREYEPWFPGDEHIERRIRAFIRWNAAMMVVKANKHADGIGGHLSTFASPASMPAPTSKAVSPTTTSITSVRRSGAAGAACRATRTHG